MNIFENVSYNEDRMFNRKIVDEKHILIMQIALRPGQTVPRHNANSNVRLLILKGSVTIDLAGEKNNAAEGDLIPVAFQTPMMIENTAPGDALFLVLKTPNPSEM